MNSKTNNNRSNPTEAHSSGKLKDAQQDFATVVGQALAEAWHRKWRKGDGRPAGAPQQGARASTQPP